MVAEDASGASPTSQGIHHPKLSGGGGEVNRLRGTEGRSGASSPRVSTASSAKTRHTILDDLMRAAVAIIVNLAGEVRNRDDLLELGVVDAVLQPRWCRSSDRRIRRNGASVVARIMENGGDSSPRHQDVIAKGLLPVLVLWFEVDTDISVTCGDTRVHLGHREHQDCDMQGTRARPLDCPTASQPPLRRSLILRPLLDLRVAKTPRSTTTSRRRRAGGLGRQRRGPGDVGATDARRCLRRRRI